MTDLDFLPDWYHARQERRRGYFMLFWLAGSLLAVMSLWFVLSSSQISQARADLENITSERAAVNEHLVKIDKLRAVRDDLIRKSTLAAGLHGQPDAIHVISRVLELMPAEVYWVSLEMTTEAIKAPDAAGPPVRPARGAPVVTPPPADAQAGTRYKIKLVGVAPVDEVVGELLKHVTRTEGFDDVQVAYVRDLKQGGRMMRQFEVTCHMAENWRPPARSGAEAVKVSADPGAPVRPADDGVASVDSTQE